MKSIHHLSDDELLDALRQSVDALPDAPAALQRAAVDLWAAASTRGGPIANAGALVKRVFAVLAFDSAAAPAFAHGMRSLQAATRHLLFSAEGRDVDLRIVLGADVHAVAGQILGPDESGTVELAACEPGNLPSQSAPLDALGEFRFEAVPPGSYALTLRLSAEEIVLQPIDVGAPVR